MKHKIIFALIAILGAVCDIITKGIVINAIRKGGNISVIPGVLQFKETFNKGIIFGLFPGAGTAFLLVAIAAVPVIIIIFLYSTRRTSWFLTISLGLILAGTLGNTYDRIAFGGVRDFIDFYIIGWPLFNLADSFICIGVFLLSIYLFFIEGKKEKTTNICKNI